MTHVSYLESSFGRLAPDRPKTELLFSLVFFRLLLCDSVLIRGHTRVSGLGEWSSKNVFFLDTYI